MKYIIILFILILLTSCLQKTEKKEKKQDVEITEEIKKPDQLIEKVQYEIPSDMEKRFESKTLDTSFFFLKKIEIILKSTDSLQIEEYFLSSEILDSLTKKPRQ